ncbi:hypothetical protein HK096_000777 [Nowakowskiella sp. JEL0078]|nr:hypothetical protein HK096_000777 [Nowakowskiella sp. JEL0078]
MQDEPNNMYPPLPPGNAAVYSLFPERNSPSPNIMKFPKNPNFSFQKLQPPIRMIRKNKFLEIEQLREKNRLMAAAEAGNIDEMLEINEEVVTAAIPEIDTIREKKFDPRKLMAQINNQYKKKDKPFVSKRKFKVRHGADDGVNVDGENPISRAVDQDKYPWMLMHGNGSEKDAWYGNLDASSSHSKYMYFVLSDNHFKVLPAGKVYKFMQKPQYATLGIAEVEAQMKSKKKSVPIFMMHEIMAAKKEKQELNDDMDIDEKPKKKSGGTKKVKSAKDIDEDEDDNIFESKSDITNSVTKRLMKRIKGNNSDEDQKPIQKTKKNSKSSQYNDEDDGADFEEDFEDDEEIVLGIDDEEEHKKDISSTKLNLRKTKMKI